jgi:hypothetical protein
MYGESCPCVALKHTSAARPASALGIAPPAFPRNGHGQEYHNVPICSNLCTAINVAKIHAITFGLIHIAKHTLQKVPINTFCHFELFV